MYCRFWVEDRYDVRMHHQATSDALRVRLCSFHAQRKRWQTPVYQVGPQRVQQRPGGGAHYRSGLARFIAAHHAGDHVAMAAKELGSAVQYIGVRDSGHLRDFVLSAFTEHREVDHIETRLIFEFRRNADLAILTR